MTCVLHLPHRQMCNITAVYVRILENKSWPEDQLSSHGFSWLPHANTGILHVSYHETAVHFHSIVTSLFVIHHPTFRSNLNLQGYDSIVKKENVLSQRLKLNNVHTEDCKKTQRNLLLFK